SPSPHPSFGSLECQHTLAFSLTGTGASVTVTYDTSLTVPPDAAVPAQATLMLIAAAPRGFGSTRMRRC
ncbi:MAG TPA: hypothetical protein PK201_14815, partial [Accumulibacter sp.]|nr:hypothetical protein [Accumulibacter sp.]